MQPRLWQASRLAVWPLRFLCRVLKSSNLQERLQPNPHRGEIHFRFAMPLGGEPLARIQ
jgi:hypothetical protein